MSTLPDQGFRVPTCSTCGHAEGDHQSSGSRFPHPLRYGLCRVAGCDCREFVERDTDRDAA